MTLLIIQADTNFNVLMQMLIIKGHKNNTARRKTLNSYQVPSSYNIL